MLIIKASVPADQGLLVIKALQQIIDAKTGEREQYYQSRYEGMFQRREQQPDDSSG